MSAITSLPIEIITEIFKQIILQREDSYHRCDYTITRGVKNKKLKSEPCFCWKLDILGAAMVCAQWYSIASHVTELMGQESQPWMALINYANKQRAHPFRSRFTELLNESLRSHLSFHLRIRHLVIDFQSFDPIANDTDGSSLFNTMQLLKLCPNIEQLDIVFDASFSSLVSDDSSRRLFSSTIDKLSHCIQYESKCRIKRLELIGHNPLQRCSCCAGKVWDAYLPPLLKSLQFLDTLVLQHVLPSQQVLQALACQTTIKKIVLHKSIITIPRPKEASEHKQRMTTIGLIPDSLWKQVKSIEIYEDIEESTTWPAEKYLLEITNHIQDLESFLLQFGTLEENKRMLWPEQDCHFNFRSTSPLLKLKTKCGESLKRISLVNVPELLF